MTLRHHIALVLFLVTGATVRAQSVDVNRADLARQQAPIVAELGPTVEINGQAIPSPNDADLGEQAILARQGGYRPFTVSVALPFYYTTNVALVKNGEQDDWVQAPIFSLSYQPQFSDTFYGYVGVREQLFYYDQFTALNFGALDVEAGLIYIIPQWHNLTLRGSFLYERLTDKNSFEAFFNDYSFLLDAEVPFRFGRAQQVFVGVDTRLSADAVPEQPRRNDYEAYVGYSLAITRALTFDATGRLAVRTYQLTDRVDVNEIFSSDLRYDFTQYVSGSIISTLAANQSNHDVFDYKVANVGGLLSLTIRF